MALFLKDFVPHSDYARTRLPATPYLGYVPIYTLYYIRSTQVPVPIYVIRSTLQILLSFQLIA